MTTTWWLYLLLCEVNKIYAGTTTDVERRFQKHCHGTGARFTRINKPIKILAAQPFSDRSAACKTEYQLKKRSQLEKLAWAQEWLWANEGKAVRSVEGMRLYRDQQAELANQQKPPAIKNPSCLLGSLVARKKATSLCADSDESQQLFLVENRPPIIMASCDVTGSFDLSGYSVSNV